MIKISKSEKSARQDSVDLAELAEFLEGLPEITEEIGKTDKIPKGDLSKGILNLSFEPGGRLRVGFEKQAEIKGDQR